MEQTEELVDEIIYPSITFKIEDDIYAISSKYVKTIMQMPKYKKIPNANPIISGVFMLRDLTVPMLDLRKAFGVKTVDDECREFAENLEKRKDDHINWITELKRCTSAGKKFTLTTDPHQCAFGRWYDKYKSNHNIVNAHLNQILLPHEKLHKSAEIIEKCIKNGEQDKAREVLEKAENLYMPRILQLIEETESIYREAYRQMVLVLSDDENTLGVVVDEVVSVENLSDAGGEKAIREFNNTNYIDGIKLSEKTKEIVIGLDDKKILGLAENFDANKPMI